MPSNLHPIKITIVGDDMIGKTSLLETYTRNKFPHHTLPTLMDIHECNISVDDKNFALTLVDTAGQEDYKRLRPLSYLGTDCFLICYSISSRTSFDNVTYMWMPKVRHYSPNIPIILVGTKSDLRIPNSDEFVTFEEGENLKQKIKAFSLVECSAKNRVCVEDVFQEAVRATVEKQQTCIHCTIL